MATLAPSCAPSKLLRAANLFGGDLVKMDAGRKRLEYLRGRLTVLDPKSWEPHSGGEVARLFLAL